MKTCPGCKIEKEASAFALCRSRKDGLQVYCTPCQTVRRKAWGKKNPERERANRRARYDPAKQKAWDAKSYKLHREERDARNKQWKAENPLWVKRYNLWRKFRLTVEEYQVIFDQQQGRCAICHQELQEGRYLHVDHNHACCPQTKSCGKCIRGLLCFRCNTLLGNARDDIHILAGAIEYLKKHRKL